MADLRTDYKDDVLDTSVNTQRKYQMTTNEDGTVSFTDVTEYSQVGDTFGAVDVNAMNEAVNSCFQSVSDGKALVASAITDKGVSTAADATFETMASNIASISTGIFANLGVINASSNSVTFNVKTLLPNVDYSKLSSDNFVVGIEQVISRQQSASEGKYTQGTYLVGIKASGVSISKSYNASTGVLTVSGCQQNIYATHPEFADNRSFNLVTQYMRIRAYFVQVG